MKRMTVAYLLFAGALWLACSGSRELVPTRARQVKINEVIGYHAPVEMTIAWYPYQELEFKQKQDRQWVILNDTMNYRGGLIPMLLITYPESQDSLWLDMHAGYSQQGMVFQNATPIEPERYKGIEGDPMLFKEWQPGRIIGKGGEIFPDVILNFNGYSHGFEAKQGDHYIELDERQCVMVELFQQEDTLRFATELLPPIRGQWVQQLFVDRGIYCIKHFNVEVSTQVVQNVGNKVEFKRFNPKAHYFFLEDGNLQEFRPRYKTVVKLLGNSKEVAKYIDDNEIDVETDEGLIKTLKYYAVNKGTR